MASSRKKAQLDIDTPPDESSSGASSSEENAPSNEIQVEFQARIPESVDFYGVLRLLQQSFLYSGIQLTLLADHIIEQRFVGSVITQTETERNNDEATDDEFDDLNNSVFAVTSVVNISVQSDLTSQIVASLVKANNQSLKTNVGNSAQESFEKFLKAPNNQIGFIISERFINMPPQISAPLYEALFREIRKAASRRLPFNFTHYILVSSMTEPSGDQNLILFSNPEEEVFVSECDMVFDFTWEGDKNSAIESIHGAKISLKTKRKMLLFKDEKFEGIIRFVRNLFPS